MLPCIDPPSSLNCSQLYCSLSSKVSHPQGEGITCQVSGTGENILDHLSANDGPSNQAQFPPCFSKYSFLRTKPHIDFKGVDLIHAPEALEQILWITNPKLLTLESFTGKRANKQNL